MHPSGLPGTAGRGPACPVVWGAGGQSSRLPDLGHKVVITQNQCFRKAEASIQSSDEANPTTPNATTKYAAIKIQNRKSASDLVSGGAKTIHPA